MKKFDWREYLKRKMSELPPYYNLKFLVFNLKVCGSWRPIDKKNHYYTIWSIFTLSFTMAHFLFIQTAFVVTGWDASEEMASAFALLINNYVHCFKICVVIRNRKRIQNLLDYVESEKFTCDDFQTARKLRYKYSRMPFMHYARFQIAGLVACSGWTLAAMLRGLKDENEKGFPTGSWYPYDFRTSPCYEITFFLQTVALFNLCIHNISLDGLFISFMAVIGCEFQILNTRIKEIGDKEIGDGQLADFDYGTMNVLQRRNIDRRMNKELSICVEHHLAIIEFANEFEDIFQLAIFLQFLDNCCVICMSAFALAQLPEYNLPTILSNFSYLTAITYQLFMYCYFGSIVENQVFNTISRRNRIKVLLESMNSEQFTRYNSKYENLLISYTRKGIFHHIAYQSFGAVAVFCWGFSPIADLIAGRNRRLPIDGWYPYNTTNTPAFELTCFHQTLGVIIACFHNVAEDTLVTGLLTVASCQFEILKSNLSNIGKELYKNSQKYLENELKNCIEHHEEIIDFTKEIGAIFGTTIIVQFTVNSIIICFNAFHISKMRVFVLHELIGITMYTCCMTYQIFIYCWHGNEIVLQSESVVVAAYSGNWWGCGERFKRGLRLLMARANRPVTLKAGNLLTLSLQTFVSILRASYSFFTVLQSSTNKI